MFDDLYVVIAVDGVASDDRRQHDASMLLMRHRFDMATAAEIGSVWGGAPAGTRTSVIHAAGLPESGELS